MYLKDRSNEKGQCYPAIGTIAKELGLSRKTVERAIRDLETAGYLVKEQRWRENGGRIRQNTAKIACITLKKYAIIN